MPIWLRCLFATLVISTAGCGPRLAEGEGVVVLDRATFSADDQPPEQVTLPHRWSDARPGAQGYGRYRFEVPPSSEAAAPHAIFLPDLNMNAEVFVDGRWIGRGGNMVDPASLNWNRPLLFAFDGAGLADGAEVEVRLFAYAGDWGGLGPVWLGPEEVLRPIADAQRRRQVVPAQVASVIAALIAVVFGALWWALRRSMYGYFALAAFFYTGHSLCFHVEEAAPLPFYLGRWSIHAALDLFGAWQLRALHRWLGLRRPGLERAVLAWSLGGAVITGLLTARIDPPEGPVTWFLPVAVAVHLGIVALLPYAVVVTLRAIPRLPRLEAGMVLLGTFAVLAVSFHAMAAHLGWLPQNAPRLLPLIGPVLLVCFGGIMLADFIRTYQQAQRSNVELDRRVKDKEAELAENYERLRVLEAERVLVTERERIMREMHDGMGSSLVATLSLVERAAAERHEVAEALRDALTDMRVVIDSLDPSVDDLSTMLGMIRSRLGPRIEQHGLSFRWRVDELPEPDGWGPSETLHAMRIVQEAITNVVKHAEATTITVQTGVEEGEHGRRGFVRVADDGRGMGEGAGRGVSNMRHRAQQLGGELAIGPGDAGVVVTLFLPPYSSSASSPRLTAS